MSESKLYPPPTGLTKSAWIDQARYEALYAASIDDPEAFWREQAERELDWIKPFTRVKDCSFAADDLHVRWFEDGELNVAANCLDRHLEQRGEQTAIIWESDDGSETRRLTYRELHEQVCRFANALKAVGAKKGDRITIYMPMIPKPPWRCWRARESGRSIRSYSADSHPRRSGAGSRTVSPTS